MGSIEDQMVLRMVWDNGKDVSKYTSKVKIKEPGKKGKKLIFNTLEQLKSESPTFLTRRQVLCQINSVFDPLGLVAPFVLEGKLLMRETWETEKELAWDDNLAADISASWLLFFKELFQLRKVKIRRCARSSFTAVGSPTLVLFSDASEVAFGACAYVVWHGKAGKGSARLLTAKRRLAPTKRVSLVRLEFCGALMVVRLRRFLCKHSRWAFAKIMYIVDSEIVRAMLQKDSYGFKTFIGVRVGEIQTTEEPHEFYWIAGGKNIADLLSRGSTPDKLLEHSEWQQGPEFLQWQCKSGPNSNGNTDLKIYLS